MIGGEETTCSRSVGRATPERVRRKEAGGGCLKYLGVAPVLRARGYFFVLSKLNRGGSADYRAPKQKSDTG